MAEERSRLGATGARRGTRQALWWWVAGANLVAVIGLTVAVTAYFDGAHNGRVSGHEALSVAGTWGLYGLGLAVAGRRFRHPYLRNGARALLGAALVYLMLGALPANARWALPVYRYGAYAAVLGSIWLAEWLLEPGAAAENDVHGVLSLLAALSGVFVLNFEVLRWLEPAFTLPDGVLLTPAMVAWQRSTVPCLTAAAWGAYAVALGAAGVRLRSWRTRLLAGGLAGVALLYLTVAGAPVPAAALGVRLLAYGAAAGGALAVAAVSRMAPGERHRLEPILWRLLPWVIGVAALIWTILEVT